MNPALQQVFLMHQGALWLLLAASGHDAWWRGSRASRGAFFFYLITAIVAGGLSGILDAWLGRADAASTLWLWTFLVPFGAMFGMLGIAAWLGLPWRNRRLGRWMAAAAGLCALACLSHVALGASHLMQSGSMGRAETSLLLVGVLSTVAVGMAAGVSARMAWLGDQLGSWMVLGCMLTAPGLFALCVARALPELLPLPVVATVVLLHALGSACIVRAAHLRGELRSTRALQVQAASNQDALFRLPEGVDLERLVERGFARTVDAGHPGVLIVVNIFNVDTIGRDHGMAGANQVRLATMARISAVLNPNDRLGRYFDTCFVVLVAAQPDGAYLRGLALRLANQVSLDVVLDATGGPDVASQRVPLDVGVGVCWSAQVTDAHEALAMAARAAALARQFDSRAAISMVPTMDAVDVQTIHFAGAESELQRASRHQHALARVALRRAQALRKRATTSA